MNVSITDVATTMRTRFECGGAAPEPADMMESNNGHYNRQAVCRAALEPGSSLSFMVRGRLVLLKHALCGFDGRDNYNWHSANHPRKEQVFKDRQNIMDHEIHNLLIVVSRESGIKKTSIPATWRR
jgi:hypothetical protein